MPTLSVVVPSVSGWDNLGPTLASLRDDARSERRDSEPPPEVLVVDRIGGVVRRKVRSEFPDVSLLEAASDATIPQMRAQAIATARSPLVAIIEDHVRVPIGWSRALVAAQVRHGGVVAGTVYNAATAHTVDWAAFFCEYHQLLPPMIAGPKERLPGVNTVYPRVVLDRHRAVLESGRWEDYLHRELRAAGVSLTSCPEIQLAHARHYTVSEYLAQRYWYARSFAGDRIRDRTWPIRVAYSAAAAAGLPIVLASRIVGRVWRSPEHRRTLLRAFPLVGVFVCAWGFGEAVGSALGPGDALSRVN